jgi:dTMP kinase
MAGDGEAGRGRLIVLDGPEGSGKSTQIERLARHLEGLGHPVSCHRDPGGTRAGERIRSVLLDDDTGEVAPLTEILLFLASRAQLLAEKVVPALARGEVVLLDRFHYSTIAYQVHGLARGRLPPSTLDLVRAVNAGREPDRVFILDLPPRVGMARIAGRRDRIESRDEAFHERVRAAFLRQAEADPERILVLDATRPPDEIFRRLVEEIERVL